MVKTLYIGVLFALTMVIFAVSANISKKKDKISRSIVLLFRGVIFSILANGFFIMTDEISAAVVFHSLFMASIDWLLLFLGRFAVLYTDCRKWFNKIAIPIILIAIFDTISVLVNPIFHNIFMLEQRYDSVFGNYYATVNYGPLFYLHLAFSYVLVCGFLIIFLCKSCRTTKSYRKKYSAILIGFLVVVAIDAVGMMLHLPIDLSLICYCLASFLLYFFAIRYVPKAMTDTLFSTAINMSEYGVCCFDISGRCIYINERALEMAKHFRRFQIVGKNYSEMEEYFRGWLHRHWKDGSEEKNFTETLEYQSHAYRYEFMVLQLRDKKGEALGYFVSCIDRTAEYEEYKVAHYRATHDDLTGIYNEQYFEQKVVETLHKFPDVPYVMITSDIKDFKLVNDLFGTEQGDDILRMHAKAFRQNAKENAVYGRLSDDRFAFCLPKERFSEEYFLASMRHLEEMFTNDYFRLQIKMGIYEIQDIQEPVFAMVDKCNMAIAEIKDKYSIQSAYYDDKLFKDTMEKKRIINEFEDALNKDEFEMYLQAQTNGDNRVIGAEALARWKSPKEGMIYPAVFIPILEQAGLIHLLDLYIWEQAIKKLAEWQEQGKEEYFISVNISVQDQYHLDVYHELTRLVDAYRVSPDRVKLEITESVFVTEVERHLALIGRLQEYGFRIAIDDFGSGFSSLNILKDIYADVLKIDMGFLQETANERRSEKIIKSVIELAKKLDMVVVVEGVETMEQFELLKQMNCDTYQGYYFSKPIPVDEFEERYM